jgi:ATP-binding cassette subfamily C protein
LPDAGHPLVRACEAIGRVEQITFVPPPEALRGLAMRDPVGAICLSSGVRSRRVALGGSWYRREGRALLAFRESDQRPMALIPRGSRRYQVFDPVEDTHTRVNEELAAALRPYAYTFYRPFHAQPVSLRYLMLFGLRGTWGEVALVLLLGLAVGALGTTMPLLIANVFDTIIPGAERQHMLEAALFLFAALLASTMLGLTRGFAFLRIENRVEARVQAAVFDRLLSLPAQFFRNFSSAELAQRAAAIGSIRKMLTGSAISAVFAGVFSFFSFALLFWFSRKLAMIATALTAVQLMAFAIAAISLLRLQRRSVEAQTRTSGVARRVMGGIPKIRVSGVERRAFSVWSKAAAENWVLAVKTSRISSGLGVFNIAFPLLASIAIFYAAGQRGFNISTGRFVAFLLAYGSFSGALTQLVQAAIGLVGIAPAYQSAKPILDAVPEADPSKPPAGELTGRIELSHIYFRYGKDGHLVLKDISLKINPGEFVAFVGPSGSGKSTIFRILLGFEQPESGTVFFDGQDIATLDVASVRQQMGIVLQNSTLFSGDIFQNIVCAGPFTLDQAWEAARMAGLDKDLQAMPMGMYTMVGVGGAGLSGGQRQRLMIARAIVGRPRILLFDEATSALDNQTQAVVSRSLDNMRATRVVIAHRLTTVMRADRIFVVEKGEIVQAGTYEELMKQPGVFAELAKRQLT